jgi:hypothetical protein
MRRRNRNGWKKRERALIRGEKRIDAFLRRAPRLLEEERNTIPPPEELAARPRLVVPTRTEFLRVQRQYYFRGFRLIVTVLCLGAAALWFVHQLLRYTYLFD